MKILIILLNFIVLLGLFTGCNKTTSNDAGNPVVKNAKMTVSVYPHDKNFYKNHGASYLENKDQCLSCHGADGSGGTAKVSCLQCHQSFPHLSNWVMPDQHPIQFMKNPQSCATCHGEDNKGGKSKVSCSQCHQGFPHPLEWAKPANHGLAFVAATDKKQCLTCHDSTKPNSPATQCASCHKAFPHDKGFVVGDKRHEQLARTYEGKCLNCHRDYKDNMPNYKDPDEGIGCMGCHSGKVEIHWLNAPPPQTKPETPPAPTAPGATGMNTLKKSRMPTSSPHKILKEKK